MKKLGRDMDNKWINALKEYNKDNKDHWCVPKKGSKAFEKLQKIMNKQNKPINNDINAAIKIQALFRGIKDRAKANKERKTISLQALEKYKNLQPQNTISNMMKPNENFIGNELYLLNKIKEDNQRKTIEKNKKMLALTNLQRK